MKNKINATASSAKVLNIYRNGTRREATVSFEEFDRIAKKFPNVRVRRFQASGCREEDNLYLVKWEAGKKEPFDLVHYFPPCFG